MREHGRGRVLCGGESFVKDVLIPDTIRPPDAERPHALRVALITDSREPSGLGAHMLALAGELRGECAVGVAAPREAGALLERAAGLGCATTVFDPRRGEGLRAWLAGWKPAVAHVHAGIGWEGLGLPAPARAAGAAAVVRTEHLPHMLTDAGDLARHRIGVGAVDRLICVSKAARESFLAAGVRPERIAVVRNGIAVRGSWPERPDARAALGLDSAPVLLTVARMTEQKGHDVLLEAMPAVLRAVPAARLLLVGSGPLEEALHQRARALGLKDAVRFLGRRDDVPALMAAADLFVLPSRFEGLPIVVLEAMAAGLPVIGTRVCGTTEAVEDGETGLLVEPDDAAALAAAVTTLLHDRVRRERMGRAGRARLAREFTAERMAAETLALYRELIQPSAARAA